MVWGAIAAAAGGIAGSILDKNSAKKAAKKQFQYNKALQQMNINWEKEQHLNNHQWEVQDLEKAGLNPILSVGGSSAGTISGASQSTSPGNVQTDFGSKISQLMQIKQMNSASKLQDQQSDLAKSQSTLANEQAKKTAKEAGWVDDEAEARIKQMSSNSAQLIALADQNRAMIDVLGSQKDLNTAKKLYTEAQTVQSKGTKSYLAGKIAEAVENGYDEADKKYNKLKKKKYSNENDKFWGPLMGY